jgi:hypothetical protein
MERLIPAVVFYLAVVAVCWLWPRAGRIVVGLFYVAMAIGVNAVLVLVAPEQFVALGTSEPLIPLYAWFFEEVVARSPIAFGLFAAAYEMAVGAMLLGRGRWVTWGAIGAIVHLLGITPLGIWTLANPVLVLGLVLVLREEYDRSLPQMIAAAIERMRGHRLAPHATGPR